MPPKNPTKLDIDYPTIIDNATIEKLESAFVIGATDTEACIFAGINLNILENYLITTPEFLTTRNELRNRSIILARQESTKGIKANPDFALKYLKEYKKEQLKTNMNQDQQITNEQKQKELGLNDKQAMFCMEYVKNGFIPKEAYNQVYKPKNPKVGDPSSCRLLKNVKICEFINFLKIPKSLEFEITRESQLKELDRIKQLASTPDAFGKVQWASVVKIVEVQNKMLGLDAPTKLELTGKDGGAVQVEAITQITFRKD